MNISQDLSFRSLDESYKDFLYNETSEGGQAPEQYFLEGHLQN